MKLAAMAPMYTSGCRPRPSQPGCTWCPRHHLEKAVGQARPYLPVLRQLAKELEKYPNAEFVDVTDNTEHVHIGTVDGKIQIDVVTDEETVHVRVPIETLQDVSDHLEASAPSI